MSAPSRNRCFQQRKQRSFPSIRVCWTCESYFTPTEIIMYNVPSLYIDESCDRILPLLLYHGECNCLIGKHILSLVLANFIDFSHFIYLLLAAFMPNRHWLIRAKLLQQTLGACSKCVGGARVNLFWEIWVTYNYVTRTNALVWHIDLYIFIRHYKSMVWLGH